MAANPRPNTGIRGLTAEGIEHTTDHGPLDFTPVLTELGSGAYPGFHQHGINADFPGPPPRQVQISTEIAGRAMYASVNGRFFEVNLMPLIETLIQQVDGIVYPVDPAAVDEEEIKALMEEDR